MTSIMARVEIETDGIECSRQCNWLLAPRWGMGAECVLFNIALYESVPGDEVHAPGVARCDECMRAEVVQ